MIEEKNTWKDILTKFLDVCYELLKENNFKWAIMGSVATNLQGCDLEPNDIDILVEKPETVYFISSLFSVFFGEKKNITPFDKNDTWISSKEQPVFRGKDQWNFRWTYAKWKIEELFIEITHKLPPENHPNKLHSIWESGPNIWPYVKDVTFGKYQIPVLPLEIQLETNFERGFNERVKQIIDIFKKQGYDQKLIKKALKEENLERFNRML
ncbi:MAG TPA: hypothetical protein VMX55_03290 [candidate division Zixibacteria bacterium]|nr:hypothetical protein [candidate division Zixibacteria bacterium]